MIFDKSKSQAQESDTQRERRSFQDLPSSQYNQPHQISVSATTEFGEVMQKKVALVSGSVGAKSLRDFGGLYLVHGKYLLEPAVALQADYACMVDVTPRDEFQTEINKAKSQAPNLEVEFVNADFRSMDIYPGLREVDLTIFFEVLLHQENYVGVLQQAAAKTNKYLCIAQPCLKDELFPLPASTTLLQFWPENLKNAHRTGGFWPEEPRTETFDSRYWMWGQTTSHLIDVCHGLGWKLQYGEKVKDVCGPSWDFSLLRFVKS